MAALATMPTDANNSNTSNLAANDSTNKSDRCCENTDCNVAKLVTLVPKRKTSQFVTEPCVMEKPMLINGFTTVFQIDGSAAKLSDLKSTPNSSATQKPVYRIKPNTHVHVINYVVVDDNGDTLRRINASDPEIMRKLLESQKKSAEMKLKKLLLSNDSSKLRMSAAAGSNASGAAAAGGASVGGKVLPTKANTMNAASVNAATNARIKVLKPAQAGSVGGTTSATLAPPPLSNNSNSTIQLPMRTHPNLKITAVTSAEGLNKLPPGGLGSVAATVAAATAQVSPEPPLPTPPMPLITPVPLAALQNVVVEKNSFDRMQAEIQELRRTVTMLAEAQANKLPTQPVGGGGTTSSTSLQQQRNLKRPRPN